jgi:hypothetical protein
MDRCKFSVQAKNLPPAVLMDAILMYVFRIRFTMVRAHTCKLENSEL